MSARRPLHVFLALVLVAGACAHDPATPRTEPSPCASVRVAPARHPLDAGRIAQRRARVIDSLGPGVAVFAAGWAMDNAEGDAARQNSEFYYMTGLEHVERGLLVIVSRPVGAAETRLYLPAAGPAGGTLASDVTGVDDVRCLDDASAELTALLRDPAALPTDSMLDLSTSALDDALVASILDDADIGTWRSTGRATRAARAVKLDDEIALLREGAVVTADAIRLAMLAAAPGMSEGDLESIVEGRFDDAGDVRRAFPSIVASGANALELHYNENADPLVAGDVIVMDVGTEHGRYAADVARTFPVNGSFTARQAELYEIVLGALRAGIDAARPGNTFRAVDDAIRTYFEAHECVEGIACDNFIAHFGGHFVGLDVHDVTLSNVPMAPGFVVNVEPGLYLPGESIGLRIEETVLITADGADVLSVGAPLEIADIEALMATD